MSKNNKLEYGKPFAPFTMFTGSIIPDCVMESTKISSSSKLLLGKLFQHAGKKDHCWPSRETLSKELGTVTSTLDNQIRELKELGLITTHKERSQSSSTYTILYHKIYDKNCVAENGNTMLPKMATPVAENGNTIKKRIREENQTEKNSAYAETPGGEKETLNIEDVVSKETIEILEAWFFADGKIHINLESKGLRKIDDMLEGLLGNGLNPYYKLVDDQALKMKKWTVQEIIACIEYYTKVLKKDISKMYFHDFVMVLSGSFRNNANIKDKSILADVFPKLNEQPTRESELLKKTFLNGTPVPDTIFIRAANKIKVISNWYEVIDRSNENVLKVFVDYVRYKKNDRTFDTKFICGDSFILDFVTKSIQENRIKKIPLRQYQLDELKSHPLKHLRV